MHHPPATISPCHPWLAARVMGWLPVCLMLFLLAGCTKAWNNPYPESRPDADTLYAGYSSDPNHLDPAKSYSVNEVMFHGQIYEPPLQYQYLLRPYKLVPLAAAKVPKPVLFDADGNVLPPTTPADQVARSIWTIHIKPNMRYQPHPAFAKGKDGKPLYRHLTAADVADIDSPMQFARLGTRVVTAADYVYEIKRLADPSVASPIFSLMAGHIEGFSAFAGEVAAIRAKRAAEGKADAFLDLSAIPMKGVRVIDKYTYQITLKGSYPQFRYWLAMDFFAPMPVEALRFYDQKVLRDKNISIDTFPVGSGPYMMTVNLPNKRIVLEANPNFHGESYPSRGMPGDKAKGLLKDAGKPMPFIHKVVYQMERESIPYWNKFLQGYYDVSGISSASFDQVISFNAGGQAQLSDDLKQRGIHLQTAVSQAIYYTGFNMLDDTVGGYSPRARKLRRAISIALDYDQYIRIFLNGRGVPAQGPIPPLVFGHQKGKAHYNHYVFDWENGKAVRKPISAARKLLAEAGYPDGIDPKTGKPLVLYLDTTGTGPNAGARLGWFRKQLARLDITLVIRNTTYNRLQQKMATGSVQMFSLGWLADYPDPENFLFLLYGPNGKVKHGGENVSNYENPAFDALYDKMRDLPDGAERDAVIAKMVDIVRKDAPWVWGFYPKTYTLNHDWLSNRKINTMANNTIKYERIDGALRARQRKAWNKPVLWPLAAGGGIIILAVLPALVSYRRRQRRTGRQDPH